MASSAQFAEVEKLAHHQLTMQYGEHLIQARHDQGPCFEKIPAWTPHRSYLSEALDYITPGSPSECIADGVVIACIIDRNSGDHPYLDSEVAIFQICASINPRICPREYAEKREVVIQAWERTWKTGTSLVVVQAPDFHAKTLDTIGPNYVVLDHFRVSLMWPEEDEDGLQQHMARLEKCNLRSRSWWTPKQPNPPLHREYLDQIAPPLTDPCLECGKQSPWIYNEVQLCLDFLCPSFWTPMRRLIHSEIELSELTFTTSFLLYRTYLHSYQHPTFPLTHHITNHTTPLLSFAPHVYSKLLLRGIVCPKCQNILPKIYWHLWRCNTCPPDVKHDYLCNLGVPSLEAVVPRPFISYQGHPYFSSQVPSHLGQTLPRAYKSHVAIDRWTLHDGCELIVLSPTRSFNENLSGPNNLFKAISNDANSGHLKLHRCRDSEPPALANHFQSTWGAEYGFHGFEASSPLTQAPASVSTARDLLEQVVMGELGNFPNTNSVQIFGFLDGQGLEWHTDGEGELGETMSILNLGGDATFRLRLQQGSYTNMNASQQGHEALSEVISGERTTAIKPILSRGQSASTKELVAHSAGGHLSAGSNSNSQTQSVASLPLIHGSVVILQGLSFSKHYEHSLDTRGPLTFQVITRIIDEQKHNHLMTKHASYSARPNGLLFSAKVHSDSDSDASGTNYDSDSEPSVNIFTAQTQEPRPAVSQIHSLSHKNNNNNNNNHYGHRYSGSSQQSPYDTRDTGDDSVMTPRSRNISSNGNTWTQSLENRLVYMHNSGMTYHDIREADELLSRWSVTALSTAYKRILSKWERTGGSHLSPSPPERGINKTNMLSIGRRRRSPQPASLASGSGQPWTQQELDQLWDLRHRVPPLSYTEIARIQGHRRTEKAYREQMVLEKKKRALTSS